MAEATPAPRGRRTSVTFLYREPRGVDGVRLFGQSRARWLAEQADAAEIKRLRREALLPDSENPPMVPRIRVGIQPNGQSRRLSRNCRMLRHRAGFRVGVAARYLGLSTRRLQRMEWSGTALAAVTIFQMSRLYGATLDEFFVGIAEDLGPLLYLDDALDDDDDGDEA